MRARGTKKQAAAVTARIKKEFLGFYAELGAIHQAAVKVGIDRDTILRWRKKDKAFDDAVMSAFDKNTDLLEVTAMQRALTGTSKGADTLLIFLLKGRKPDIYRERYDVTGSGSFTLRDFLLHSRKEGPGGGGSKSPGLRPPGVVLDADIGGKPMGKATRSPGVHKRA